MITQNYFKKHLKIFDCAKSLLPHKGFLSLQCLGSSLQWLLCEAQALAAWASVAVARGLSNCCSRTLELALSSSFQACGILLDHGLGTCVCRQHPLHWQAHSHPLHHQGSPQPSFIVQLNCLCFRLFALEEMDCTLFKEMREE